jgi:hypothetical protein
MNGVLALWYGRQYDRGPAPSFSAGAPTRVSWGFQLCPTACAHKRKKTAGVKFAGRVLISFYKRARILFCRRMDQVGGLERLTYYRSVHVLIGHL